MTTRLAVPALLAALLALPAPASATPGLPRHVPGEVLVKFKDGTTATHRASAMAAHAHAALGDLQGGWMHVRLRPGETVEEAVATYLEDPGVAWAQPNFVYRAFAVPNDPDYAPYQWALHNTGQTIDTARLQPGEGMCPDGAGGACPSAANPGISGDDIGAEAAWDLVRDCSSVVVAVVDTGVNYNHQDLAGNLWVDPNGQFTKHGADFVSNNGVGDDDPMDENGHGTHVAGILGARGNNGVGGAGVCWSVRIMAVRVLDANGGGTTVSIRSGVDFARVHRADVVNLSLGGNGFDQLFSDAIDAAVNAGILVVVAAGNEATNNDATPSYPCNFASPGIVCVAALDQANQLADFSNWGANSVDVGAPGVNIVATWPGSQTATQDSFLSGWTLGSGWATATVTGPTTILVNPPDWVTNSSPRYTTPADMHAWKTFNTAGADVARLETFAAIDVSSGDYIRVRCSTAAGDPIPAGVLLEEDTNFHTGGGLIPVGVDVSPCKGATTTVGLQLQSALPVGGQDFGVAFGPFTLTKLTWNTTSYNTLAGTSMATPVVAGVAALVKAYQPAFKAADLAGAITGGGQPIPSLTGKTKTGKAVRALGALTYLNPPRGLTYAVH